jgi:hypothetical protein
MPTDFAIPRWRIFGLRGRILLASVVPRVIGGFCVDNMGNRICEVVAMDIERSGTPQVSVCTGNKADSAEHFDSVLGPQPGADFLGFCLMVVFPVLEFVLVIENIFPGTNKIKVSA